MRLFDNLRKEFKNTFRNKGVACSSPVAPVAAAPDRRSIYRNRSNFGVNFGSLFVQERWIFSKFFPEDGTSTEFDGVSQYIQKYGEDQTRQDLEQHWLTYASDDDWNWLRSKGVTGVRIPIGYWHVAGGNFTQGTPFNSIATVYSNAWEIFKQIVQKANGYGIGVIVDLHALPGGANADAHSGVKLDSPQFWSNLQYQALVYQMLEFIASDLGSYENIIGLQLVNESIFDNEASKQKLYYSEAINRIRKFDSNIPIIISDGWWTDQWVKWIKELELSSNGQSIGVVIDSHIYRCFHEADKAKSPEQIISDLDNDCLTNLSGPADIILGEYCHVLDEQSWSKASHDRSELVQQFGHELNRVLQRANTGTFFWTFKFQWGDGGEWGLVPQIGNGNLLTRNTGINRYPEEQEFNDTLSSELKSHEDYWKSQNPNENYEHWRYQEGFTTGWADAVEFARFDASRIGRMNAWTSSRRVEHISNRGSSGFLWEWDQGFAKGIEKAQAALFG